MAILVIVFALCFSLPMRDGNTSIREVYETGDRFSLPMRDGNVNTSQR